MMLKGRGSSKCDPPGKGKSLKRQKEKNVRNKDIVKKIGKLHPLKETEKSINFDILKVKPQKKNSKPNL